MWDEYLGRTTTVKHRVDLELLEIRPINSVPYHAGPKRHDLERCKIENMLAMNVTEPVRSEWASPVVFVQKKDGNLRFCADYSNFNTVDIHISYPLSKWMSVYTPSEMHKYSLLST